MAPVKDVQPVETMWLRPRNPKRMDTSLASVPVGMLYTLHWAFPSTAFAVPDGWKRKRLECLTKGPLRHVAGLLESVFLITLKHGNRSSYQTDRRSWRISSSGGTR